MMTTIFPALASTNVLTTDVQFATASCVSSIIRCVYVATGKRAKEGTFDGSQCFTKLRGVAAHTGNAAVITWLNSSLARLSKRLRMAMLLESYGARAKMVMIVMLV